MIKSIEEIRNLGCFNDLKWNDLPKFDKYNFLFGFNGSGKTTLSNIFNLVTSKSNYSEDRKQELFKDLKLIGPARIKISASNNQTLTYPTSTGQNNRNVYVFNSNFISEHVYDGTKGNLKKFNVSSTELNDPEIQNISDKIVSIEKSIKDYSEAISKTDNLYSEIKKEKNSDFRNRFANKQLSVEKNIPSTDSIPKESLEELNKKLSNNIKDQNLARNQKTLVEDVKIIEELSFYELSITYSEIEKLIKGSVTKVATDVLAKKISNYQKVVDDQDVKKVEPWFKFGHQLLKIHTNKEEKRCPLCDSNIKDNKDFLLEEYSAYFDKAYELFVNNIERAIRNIDELIQKIHVSDKNYLKLQNLITTYSEFVEIIPQELSNTSLESSLRKLSEILNNKLTNSNSEEDYNLDKLRLQIDGHNRHMNNSMQLAKSLSEGLLSKIKAPSEIESSAREVYKLLVYKSLDSKCNIGKYHSLKNDIQSANRQIETLQEEKIQRLKDLKLEAKNVGLYLTKLGINHFTIDLNEESEQDNILIKYKSLSQVKSNLKNTLSEGEKTALAFAYFLSKVSIETKEPNQTIVVVDDPISSLDDHRIYNTASLIFDVFKEFKQVFILSHNFFFLKYIFPLFRKEKQCYLISNGKISLLPRSLQNFQTPYYYMIESIASFIENTEKDYDEARKYLPNYIRRVLETFFSFKYAKITRARNENQSPGLDDFIKDYIDYDSLPDFTVGGINRHNLKEKLQDINNICDNYSHGNMQHLENTNFMTNQSLDAVSEDCLSIIEYFDGLHFQKVTELSDSGR